MKLVGNQLGFTFMNTVIFFLIIFVATIDIRFLFFKKYSQYISLNANLPVDFKRLSAKSVPCRVERSEENF